MRRVRHPGHKMEGGHLSRAQASTGVAPESRASSHLVPALSGLFHGLLQGRLGGGAPDTALSYMLSNSTVRCGPASLLTLKVGDSKKKPPGGGAVWPERVKFFQVGAQGHGSLALTFLAGLPGLHE